ncbi:nuclear transport factor 2 family protein [Paraburkholderia sp. GAS42]|uniref:nuclear transport factor 2 family protein n=1 Tax=Paraburkholderia sp. GAS42 TaxID=3035135 RepID=UPI003D251EC4
MALNRFNAYPFAFAFAFALAICVAIPAHAQTQTAPANIASLSQAEQNRQVVLAFQEQFFNQHDLSAADRFVAENYVQHNPTVPDGRKALVEVFTKVFERNPQARSDVVRSAVDGDLVYVHLHSTLNPSDRGRAIVNIYRVTNGKITEHWDVIQLIPEQSANSNTMF